MTAHPPLVEELLPAPDAEAAFVRFAGRRGCLFLDSALRDATLGRYSYLSADPFATLELPPDQPHVWEQVSTLANRFTAPQLPDLPAFQGGLAGLFGYDLNRSLERIAAPRYDEFQVPALHVGLYDTVLAWDHAQGRAWLVSQGFPETQAAARRTRAASRIRQFKHWLRDPPLASPMPRTRLAASELAPQFACAEWPGVTSNFSADGYRDTLRRAIELIFNGEMFQVNLAQRLLAPATDDAVSLYLRMRRRNPAPFAGYFNGGAWQVASASPERFVQAYNGLVEARPIKGTRRRTLLPEADLFAGDDLQQSEKERAENIMIVDLLRNDLSRVCRDESVQVDQLCRLEVYAFVQHLVSVVRGQLRPEATPLDLLRAAFPGGSITGAPKVRAMEIISELEPTARGPYCGSLGYLSFGGALDLSILIRTVTAARGWWQFPVGGGIVAQSDPQREYEETWHKAEGVLRSLNDTGRPG